MPLHWTQKAACKNVHVSHFYPLTTSQQHHALSYCKQCHVTSECRQHALDNNEEFGIWGGTTEKERRKLVATRNNTR